MTQHRDRATPPDSEVQMTIDTPEYEPPDLTSLSFADNFVAEDEVLAEARDQGLAMGCIPMGPGSGAMLRFVASAINARHVVEIGTGAGISSLWLLRGMPQNSVLTSIDIEADHQRSARETFLRDGITAGRFRLITGRAMEVLPRLTDDAYDLVLVDTDPDEYSLYLEQALRLLRPGGVIVLNNSLFGGKIAQPAERDEATVALRELVQHIQESKHLVPVLVPSGAGLLMAVVR
jgi:predicted O-methyltransferase YrrM